MLSDRQAAAGGATFEASIGAYSNEPVALYGREVSFVKLGRAVGRLDVLTDTGVFPCTAFLVSDKYLVTNHHCVPGIVDLPETRATRIEAVQLVLGYLREGISDGTRTFSVSPVPVEADRDLDYSVLEVFGNPSADFGTVRVASVDPIPDNYAYWIIGHPLKGPQRISREQCRSDAPAVASGRLRHTCDTLPGNSGSPVIDPETKAAIALHHAGSTRDAINFAVPMAAIIARSKVLAALAARQENRSDATPARAAPAQAPQSEEAVAWGTIQGNATCGVLGTFIRRYAAGGSVFVDFARARERELNCGEEKVAVGTFPEMPAPAPSPGVTECDRLAAPPSDPRTKALGLAGVEFKKIHGPSAVEACREALAQAPHELRFVSQLGRALEADGHYDEAVRWYRKAAEAGDARGMNNLGLMYEDGRGVGKDEAEAVRWYRKAAEAGNEAGMSNLGLMYEEGRGVGKDEAEAVRWYRKAAEAGNARGMTYLGWMYANGRGVGKDEAEAVRWYRKAAEAGHALGMNNLGVMYGNGRGVGKDDAEAVRWYRKSAEAGEARGMHNLGWMYAEGRGVGKDEAEAVRWYRKAAEAGHALGMNNLGLMYDDGRGGLRKDEAEAVRWYRMAAEAGNAGGMNNLGLMYADGRGVGKDEAEAVRWYRKAAEAGHAGGMHNLGVMYGNGRGVGKDEAEAVRWYRKAAEAGHAGGMHNLGLMYDDGRGGLRKDGAEAARWVHGALAKGNQFSLDEMKTNAKAWSPEFRRALQQRLKDAGHYSGPVDGQFGPATIRAIEAIFGKGGH